jgi:hypothetical protein
VAEKVNRLRLFGIIGEVEYRPYSYPSSGNHGLQKRSLWGNSQIRENPGDAIQNAQMANLFIADYTVQALV